MCCCIFIVAAMLHSTNEKTHVPDQSHQSQVQAAELWAQSSELQASKEIVKTCGRLSRWHCVWLLPAFMSIRQSLAWAQQLQHQLRGFDLQHKSFRLEPHPAVPSVQQLLSFLSHSKLVLFQIITSIFFFSRSSTIIFFQFLDLAQNIPEVSRNI